MRQWSRPWWPVFIACPKHPHFGVLVPGNCIVLEAGNFLGVWRPGVRGPDEIPPMQTQPLCGTYLLKTTDCEKEAT